MYYVTYFTHLFLINLFTFWLQTNNNIINVFSKNIDWTQMFILVSTKTAMWDRRIQTLFDALDVN